MNLIDPLELVSCEDPPPGMTGASLPPPVTLLATSQVPSAQLMSWRQRLLDLWHEENEFPELRAYRPDVIAWDGATKDLLLGLGLEWNEDKGDYLFVDPPVGSQVPDAREETPTP